MKAPRVLLAAALTVALGAALLPMPGAAAQVDQPSPLVAADVLTPAARRAVAATGADDMISVIVSLDDQLDLARLAADGLDEGEAVEALQDHAAREQALIRLLAPIWELGPAVESFEAFWITNSFAITARPDVIIQIANLPDVRTIDVEQHYVLAGTAPTGPVAAHVDHIGAPAAWADGFTGEGVVVAVLDTGVDITGIPGVFPSEVASTWRGGTNSWFDPYAGSIEPYDLDGHGTAVASIITGGGSSGEVVGVAPGAQWIAAKVFSDQGTATTSAIRASLQWVLDPDGDPTTDDGADIVNASWTNASIGCDTEFAPDIAALRAAGVLPVFAAGNHGPLPASAPSPANLPGVLAVGALDATDTVLASSSRGPTECGGATRTFPHLTAPGDNIVAQSRQGQYVAHSGTSFAAPHVAGAAAVLTEALGAADADLVEAALIGSARDLGVAGLDDFYGAGIVDIPAALTALGIDPNPTPTVGSVAGQVWLDHDRSGDLGAADIPTSAVQLSLLSAGDDATWDTADDAIVAEAVTGPDGTYHFSSLAPGAVRLRVDTASLPAGAIVDQVVVDLDVVAGVEATHVVLWRHPDPGTVVVTVVDDGIEGSGSSAPLTDVGVTVESIGIDGVSGTADDVIVTGTTDASGSFTAVDIPAGDVIVELDRNTLPELGYILGSGRVAVVVPSGGTATVDMIVRVPTEREVLVLMSTKRAGVVNDLPYHDEDVIAWDGARFTMLFDGSDVGIAGRDIDAVHMVDAETLLLSFDRPVELDGVGLVSDGDIVRFTASRLGEQTRGTFSLEWVAADSSLGETAVDIDALTEIDGTLAVSFRGNLDLGDRIIRDEDLVLLTDGDLGAVAFDGSEEGLEDRSEDIDAAAAVDEGFWLSTLGVVRATGLLAGDGDVLACVGEPCAWAIAHGAGGLGLPAGDLDGLSLPVGGE